MSLDIDYIVARNRLKEIEAILEELPHGERAWIADELDSFHNWLVEKRALLKKVQKRRVS